MIDDIPILVLNQNYQPLNVCNVKRAISMLGAGKAEPMKNSGQLAHSVSQTFVIPSVIRLIHMVSRPLMIRKLSRHAIFDRDKFTCQYCGQYDKSLTLDHIVPRSQGGRHEWENVTSACTSCNHRKAGLTPNEAGMALKRKPVKPKPDPYSLFRQRTILDDWRQFMPWVA